jgi:hypothetical protein
MYETIGFILGIIVVVYFSYSILMNGIRKERNRKNNGNGSIRA